MKHTAPVIIWLTLLDCRENHKRNQDCSGEYKRCPGCRIADMEMEGTCEKCLFINLEWTGTHCTHDGKTLLEQMEDV